MRLLRIGTGCLLLALLAAGCTGSKLNDERTVTLEPASESLLTIDPAKKDQKVTVQVTSPGAAVNVYCFLEKDQADAQKAIQTNQSSAKVLAKKEKSESASLDFTQPANSKAVVMLTPASGKTANVKVKITNK